jgi:7-keto-8-aminopelargonate synthetase-like enzyme
MKHSSPVLKRIEDDEATRLRLRYELWYRTPERQEGAHVWVDGREMILMSSNDYLGLSGHPAVVEAARRASVEWGSSTTGARLANGSRAYQHAWKSNSRRSWARRPAQSPPPATFRA